MDQKYLIMYPYAEIGRGWNFNDEFIMSLFDRTKTEGKVETVFYDGVVTTRGQFLQWMKMEACIFYIIFYKAELLGYMWLSAFHGFSANVNYCMFNHKFAKSMVKFARLCIDRILSKTYTDGTKILKVLVGETPVSNKKGLRFAELCGAERLGDIPDMANIGGKPTPCTIYYFTSGGEYGRKHQHNDRR